MSASKISIPAAPPPRLIERDMADCAKRLGCDIAAVRAVIAVETGGKGGFLPDGRPRILFEAHLFSRFTGGKYDQTHPRISVKRWTKSLYIGGAGEYDRLQEAMALDYDAALRAASWGMFQILGDNCRLCGFATAHEYVMAMQKGERQHLNAFGNFILKSRLDDEMRDRRWADFARVYNGPSYAANQYDIKLAKAYAAAGGKA